jgi:hypothetical protein
MGDIYHGGAELMMQSIDFSTHLDTQLSTQIREGFVKEKQCRTPGLSLTGVVKSGRFPNRSTNRVI